MNYPIKVFDTNLASQELFDKVMFLPYMCTRTDDPPCPDRPEVDIRNNYWTHQLYNFVPIDDPGYFDNTGLDASNDPLYLECLTYLEAVCPEMPPRDWLYSAYINCLKAGDTPGVHVDAPYWVEDNKTVLLYLNPDLDHPNFGGETIFYDHELNAQRIISPKPGRIVLFDGRVPHTGRPPTNRYPVNRYIMSFKYMEPEQRQGLFSQAEKDNREGKAPPMDMGVIGFDSKTIKDILLT
tara:strand:+ start:10651 stop:11364 length:714 start_codon:yes stop_codon:yes gene_type:complete